MENLSKRNYLCLVLFIAKKVFKMTRSSSSRVSLRILCKKNAKVAKTIKFIYAFLMIVYKKK